MLEQAWQGVFERPRGVGASTGGSSQQGCRGKVCWSRLGRVCLKGPEGWVQAQVAVASSQQRGQGRVVLSNSNKCVPCTLADTTRCAPSASASTARGSSQRGWGPLNPNEFTRRDNCQGMKKKGLARVGQFE